MKMETAELQKLRRFLTKNKVLPQSTIISIFPFFIPKRIPTFAAAKIKGNNCIKNLKINNL